MIIMFIFLGLTVVFVICTAIYLNKKKNQNGFIQKNDKKASENQSKKVDKKKLENIFNFKIKDNIICIGNRYSNIVRLGNIDYNMLSVSEQDSIENILIQTALSIDYPVQFFSTTEYIDTTKDLLLNTLKYKPFLIKPNKEELEEIFNTKIIDKEQALQYAELLQEKGAKNVIVSMGGQGAVYIDENGYTYKMEALRNPNSKIINTVGAGDSMVAGFIAGYELFKNHDKAFRMGMAAGAATVNSEFLATKEEIYELLK